MKNTIVVIISLLSTSLFSQTNNDAISNTTYLKHVLPKSVSEKSGLKILGTGFLLSSACFLVDRDLAEHVSQNPLMSDKLAYIGDHYIGDYWFAGVALLSWRVYGKKGNNYYSSLRYLAASEFFVAAITEGIKKTFHRARPNGNDLSYPSGHTSISFATATVIHHWFGYKIGIPAYSMALITGLSRINDEKHYLSDVLFGATLGIAVPTMLYHTENSHFKLHITNINTLSLSYLF